MQESDFVYPLGSKEVFFIGWPETSCYDQSMPDPPRPSAPGRPDAETGTGDVFRVAVEAGGKIVLPARVCELLGVVDGDFLVLDPQRDGTVVVLSLKRAVQEAHGIFRHGEPGGSLVDELIAERREEARREDEE